MATESAFYDEHVHKFVALNPCAIANKPVSDIEETVMKDDDGNDILNALTNEPQTEETVKYFTEETFRAGPLTTASSVNAIFGDDWASKSSTWYDAVGPVMSAVFQADLDSKYFNPAIS